MKTIPLTQGKVALVDDEDYERLSKFKWCYDKRNNYASCCVRIPESLEWKHISMACEALQTNSKVDHVDGEGLNNQKYNLRECTNSQNQQNRKKTKGKTSSKYKGVGFCCRDKNWRADIKFQDIFGEKAHVYLGSFTAEVEAARIYDKAARQYFGQFAALNFPEKGERSCL